MKINQIEAAYNFLGSLDSLYARIFGGILHAYTWRIVVIV